MVPKDPVYLPRSTIERSSLPRTTIERQCLPLPMEATILLASRKVNHLIANSGSKVFRRAIQQLGFFVGQILVSSRYYAPSDRTNYDAKKIPHEVYLRQPTWLHHPATPPLVVVVPAARCSRETAGIDRHAQPTSESSTTHCVHNCRIRFGWWRRNSS